MTDLTQRIRESMIDKDALKRDVESGDPEAIELQRKLDMGAPLGPGEGARWHKPANQGGGQ